MAFKNINQRIIKPFAIGEDGGHKLGGIIALEPGGLIGFNTVSRAMRFAKGIAAEAGDQVPDFGDFRFGAASFAGALGELGLDLSNERGFIFAQSATENISASGRQAGKGFADLEDMLFIDDQTVGAVEARLE